MKNLQKLGNALNKAEQKKIIGGSLGGRRWRCCRGGCCLSTPQGVIYHPGHCTNGNCILA